MATMKRKGTKNKSPHTRLTMALPLVLGGGMALDGVATAGGAPTTAPASRPQTRQKSSPAAMLFPQAAQKPICSPGARNAVRLALKFDETLRFAFARVNARLV